MLENILLRNGCSLIREVSRTRKKERLVPVLVKFLTLARMQANSEAEIKKNDERAENLIEKVALKIHNAFFELSEEERSQQIALFSTDEDIRRIDGKSN